MKTGTLLTRIAVSLAWLTIPLMAEAADKLAALHADASQTSVSGLSSGAFMAVQYDVAFSGSVRGVGVVAGGPYNCAYVNLGGIATCMQGVPLGSSSFAAASGFAALGQVDPVENLSKARVYLFSGTQDTVIRQPVMDAVRDFYEIAGVKGDNLVYINGVAAGHAFISPTFGGNCSVTAKPFVDKCTVEGQGYDQPGAILSQIYGTLKPKADALSATPVAFDQKEFTSGLTGMAATGYVYVPGVCQASGGEGCEVHVVLHGCEQSASEVKDDVYTKLGFNEWADTNNIIVLYPQVDPSTMPYNPKGCWDWWGYSGPDFQTRSGGQLAAIHAMVNRLTGK